MAPSAEDWRENMPKPLMAVMRKPDIFRNRFLNAVATVSDQNKRGFIKIWQDIL